MKRIITVLLYGFIFNSYADSASLSKYLGNMKTMKADFTQVIITGKKNRTSVGNMEISRPNKFRWEYTADQQLLISDSKDIYIYDKPLQQVTIKPLNKSIDKSPAALLAGSNDINKSYKISNLPDNGDKLAWFKIEPKVTNDNNGFQVVLMGFSADGKISSMKFTDTFGNETQLKFSNVQTGVNIPASEFKFTAPAGVDVLKD
ncbi:MAG: outer membrane lipoprotein chaperone LolA [Burkholderiales bacterium]|nr:outer membrane lipoprotein chaperone LolA [Burkholderiales bacterium]